ncbi:hypothetical protein PFJ02_07710 [Mycobacterium xenopi]|uniref:Uncharacterized protein n=1 Tax=Mycobacterium xenopi TaxID=1789 RepID=A0AAD1M0T4_MYCXE|nr:hypothetical protein [Mycobacterium xenopi]MDA3639714.1 hypothetical protein [Mycobacterium xenopi]MDA3658074.1 hypothetical protein [Mycobacterium xenopi]MDA3661951.1 hypothetical protein [Mycobacterium xenopi]ORX19797.1 hypothetical protein AWC32_08925 [Mycobacterium xenopi]SPX78221.1 Uncharacterised protein [Mycobacterium xenopi]
MAEPNFTAKMAKIRHECVGDLLRTASRHRPASPVSTGGKDEPDGRGADATQWHERVRGHSGQQGGRPPIGEAALGEAGDRGDPDPAKLGDGQRMLGRKRVTDAVEELDAIGYQGV